MQAVDRLHSPGMQHTPAASPAGAASAAVSITKHVVTYSHNDNVAHLATGHGRPAAAGEEEASMRKCEHVSGEVPRDVTCPAASEQRAAHALAPDSALGVSPARQHPHVDAGGRLEQGRGAHDAVGVTLQHTAGDGGEEREGLAKKVKVLRGLEQDNAQLKRNVMRLRLEVQLLRQIVSLSRCFSDTQLVPGQTIGPEPLLAFRSGSFVCPCSHASGPTSGLRRPEPGLTVYNAQHSPQGVCVRAFACDRLNFSDPTNLCVADEHDVASAVSDHDDSISTRPPSPGCPS